MQKCHLCGCELSDHQCGEQDKERMIAFQIVHPTYTTFNNPVVYPPGRILHIWGRSMSGKSHLARSLFSKSLVVSCLYPLGNPNIPWHEIECIIFEDFVPKWSLDEPQVAILLDRQNEGMVNGIPNRHTIPKIFVSGRPDIFSTRRFLDQQVLQHHVKRALF